MPQSLLFLAKNTFAEGKKSQSQTLSPMVFAGGFMAVLQPAHSLRFPPPLARQSGSSGRKSRS